MRAISIDTQAHLAGAIQTMSLCMKLVRQDSQAYCYTMHNKPLVVDGATYSPNYSFLASALESKSSLSVDNLELTIPLGAAGITKADVVAGLFTGATLDIFWVNWFDLLQQGEALALLLGIDGIDDVDWVLTDALYEAQGWRLGKAILKENQVVFEVRSLSSLLTAPVLDVITPDCPYQFGLNDNIRSFCPADLDDYKVTGAVTDMNVSETKRAFIDAARTEASDIFAFGLLTWTSGSNAGYSMEVENFNTAADTVTLLFGMPYVIEVGDAYELWRGCDKAFSTCKALGFQNDFGGEPNVPDQDTALQYKVN